jgi:hypothetical protein
VELQLFVCNTINVCRGVHLTFCPEGYPRVPITLPIVFSEAHKPSIAAGQKNSLLTSLPAPSRPCSGTALPGHGAAAAVGQEQGGRSASRPKGPGMRGRCSLERGASYRALRLLARGDTRTWLSFWAGSLCFIFLCKRRLIARRTASPKGLGLHDCCSNEVGVWCFGE